MSVQCCLADELNGAVVQIWNIRVGSVAATGKCGQGLFGEVRHHLAD